MIYEKRLLVLIGGAGGCLKTERTQSGIDCRLTGNVRGECVLAIRAGGELFAFGGFTLPPAYTFRLPPTIRTDDLVAVVGNSEGRFLMSGGFRRPMPWRGNLEDDLRRAVKMIGKTAGENKKNINDYFLDIIPESYDDGKVAEVNYYRSNLTAESRGFTPPFPPASDVDGRAEKIRGENEIASEAQSSARAEAETAGTVTGLAETDYGAARAVPELPGVTFYESVKEQVDRLFANNERYAALEKLLPESRWARVDYDEKGRYYLVGTIGDPVRYLCYGVPGEYSPTPPPDLAGYCQWLALDENDPSGKGFWIMYQDGVSGKSIL